MAKPPTGKRKTDRGRASRDGDQKAGHGAGSVWLRLSHQHRGSVSWKDSFTLKGDCTLAGVERMESS